METDAVAEIPNVLELTNKLVKMLQFMNKPEMKELKNTNEEEYDERMDREFGKFITEYYSIYKLLGSGKDINILLTMLKSLNKVNEGKCDFQAARAEVSEVVNNKYVTPKLNKKNMKKN